MTKKDYVRFARVLKDARANLVSGALDANASAAAVTVVEAVIATIEDEMVTAFRADNDRFDAARFRQACR
jgi:hypothetical protein